MIWMDLITEALALISGSVDVDFSADDVSEWKEHLSQFRVSELLRQVVDEEIASLRTNWRGRSKI